MSEPRRVALLRVDFGDVLAEHLVEDSEEDRKQGVLDQGQPGCQVLHGAETPQDVRSYRDDLQEARGETLH